MNPYDLNEVGINRKRPLRTKEILKDPSVWEEIRVKLAKAEGSYKKKRRFYIKLTTFLRVSIILLALSLTAYIIILIRAHWVCGF